MAVYALKAVSNAHTHNIFKKVEGSASQHIRRMHFLKPHVCLRTQGMNPARKTLQTKSPRCVQASDPSFPPLLASLYKQTQNG
jgi:hypothetical protein